MVTVNPSGTPISETVTVGSTLTVPSSEVWRVDIHFAQSTSSDQGTMINSIVMNEGTDNGESRSSTAKTVLVGGDTIGAPDDRGIHVSGFEISGVVDNTAVSESIGGPSAGAESFTIPAGETWKVHINYSTNTNISGNLLVNGSQITQTTAESDSRHIYTEMILEDGDTIEVESASGGAHIGGFKV